MLSFRRSGARAVVALLAGVTLAVGAVGTPVAAAPSESRARFIITLVDGADSRAVAQEYRRGGARVDFVYTAALNGFAGAMSQAELGELQRDRRVTRIERDGIATTSATQEGATWGLARIDQRLLPLDTTYSYTATGAGVNAYIIDTGIRTSHVDFGGRAVSGYDAVDGGSAEDCNGHGTHVAGTVGGAAYGVAKTVQLVAVRVLDCGGSGTWSGVIAGMDWVTRNHVKPAVANMSLGGGANTSIDDAVNRMIAAGVTTAVAAGNGNQGGKEQDACNYSPARVPAAITIGATTHTDAKTSWSNYGSCVDFFAPGYQITSAWYTGDSATNTISGTSMAAPHVAGAAALYLQGNTGASAAAVREALYASTTKGIVTSSKTANNHLLFTGTGTTSTVKDGTLQGTVTTGSGTETVAVSGATITVGTKTAKTDTNGFYALPLAPDEYTVQVTADGYETQSTAATVESEESTTVDFLLEEATNSDPVGSLVLDVMQGTKTKGTTTVTSSWTDGATSPSPYTLYLNDQVYKSGLIQDSHIDYWKGGGTLTYQVCRDADNVCSNTETITI